MMAKINIGIVIMVLLFMHTHLFYCLYRNGLGKKFITFVVGNRSLVHVDNKKDYMMLQ